MLLCHRNRIRELQGVTESMIRKNAEVSLKRLHRKATAEKEQLNRLQSFEDGGPDGETKNLWNLARKLNPSVGTKNIKLLGVDDLNDEPSLPLRPLLKVLYQNHRLKLFYELVILILFFCGLWVSLTSFLDFQTVFEQDEALQELFYDEEFPTANHKKTFMDIHAVPEFYDWLSGPLLNGIYPGPRLAKTTGAIFLPDYVSGYLHLVGPVRLRQFRVKNNSCYSRRNINEYGSRYDNTDKTCRAAYSIPNSDETPFGPGGQNKYKYANKLSVATGRSVFARTFLPTYYGPGGFVVELPVPSRLSPLNESTNVTAESLINELKEDQWIDKSTRAVFVEFNVYCTESKYLSTSQYFCEFLHDGYVTCHQRVRTYPVVFDGSELLSRQGNFFRQTCELFTFTIAIYMLFRVVKRIYRMPFKSKYFAKWSNYFEMLLLFCYFMHIIIIWAYIYNIDVLGKIDVTNKNDFIDVFDLFELNFVAIECAAISIVLCVILVIRQCSCSRKTAILQHTVSHALSDLFMFMFLVLILLIGFGLAAHVLYGPYLQPFMSFWSSLREMMGFMAGGYDYDLLARIAPYWTFIFYWMWLCFFYLIVMNMFIAILTDGYRAARDSANDDTWQYDVPNLFLDFQRKTAVGLYRLRLRCMRSHFFNIYICLSCGCCCSLKASSDRSDNVGISEDGRADNTGESETHERRLQHWIVEVEFMDAAREATRRTKHMKNAIGVLSLFDYIQKAYREETNAGDSTANPCIGISELCLLTSEVIDSSHGCDHRDPNTCIARNLINKFKRCNSVFLLRGKKRDKFFKSGITSVVEDIEQQQMKNNSEFIVTKINSWGRGQPRIMVVDAKKSVVRSFDSARKLRRILHLSKLEQIDISKGSDTRLSLSFAPGYCGHCAMLFQTSDDRKRFVHRVLLHSFNPLVKSAESDAILLDPARSRFDKVSQGLASLRKSQQELENRVFVSHSMIQKMLFQIGKKLNIDGFDTISLVEPDSFALPPESRMRNQQYSDKQPSFRSRTLNQTKANVRSMRRQSSFISGTFEKTEQRDFDAIPKPLRPVDSSMDSDSIRTMNYKRNSTPFLPSVTTSSKVNSYSLNGSGHNGLLTVSNVLEPKEASMSTVVRNGTAIEMAELPSKRLSLKPFGTVQSTKTPFMTRLVKPVAIGKGRARRKSNKEILKSQF